MWACASRLCRRFTDIQFPPLAMLDLSGARNSRLGSCTLTIRTQPCQECPRTTMLESSPITSKYTWQSDSIYLLPSWRQFHLFRNGNAEAPDNTVTVTSNSSRHQPPRFLPHELKLDINAYLYCAVWEVDYNARTKQSEILTILLRNTRHTHVYTHRQR